jgi:hypothetical protein
MLFSTQTVAPCLAKLRLGARCMPVVCLRQTLAESGPNNPCRSASDGEEMSLLAGVECIRSVHRTYTQRERDSFERCVLSWWHRHRCFLHVCKAITICKLTQAALAVTAPRCGREMVRRQHVSTIRPTTR